MGSPHLLRCYVSAVYAMPVCLSVTRSRRSIEMAKWYQFKLLGEHKDMCK